MQEHTAKKIRITVLLWLMLLALAFPYLVNYYEQRYAFQWQEMVQPHWESVAEPLPSVQQDLASDDVAEWKDIAVEQVAVEQVADAPVQNTAVALQPTTANENKAQDDPVSVRQPDLPRQKKATTVPRKKSELSLNLPENIYQDKQAAWDEKNPVAIPDFFSPRTESSSGLQFGGRLLVDEEKMKRKQKQDSADASYLDAVQGAEINIRIETK